MQSQTTISRIRRKKAEEIERLAELVRRYPVIAVFSLVGLRANLLHEIRRKLRDYCVVRVAKKTLFLKAAERAGRSDLARLLEGNKSSVGFIFSSVGLFKLKMLLDKNKVLMHAKAGEKADIDVVVPEMNTGLPPGPILSDFGKLKIPTRIEGGQIWIAKDTVVAKKGDVISPQLASLLARLDIKAVLKGIDIERGYEDGLIYLGKDLEIDVKRVEAELAEASSLAIRFAVAAGYVTRETIQPIVLKAYREARAVAVEAGIPVREVIEELIIRAESAAIRIRELVESKK